MNKYIKSIFLIVIGSFIFSIGINFFTIPNMLSEGGVIGITIITYYLFEWSPGLINILINILLFLVGYKFFDRKTLIYTAFSIVVMSLFLFLTEDIGSSLTNDTLLAAIFAGCLVGMGIGLIFRAGGTTGGTTVLARIANQLWGWSMGKGVLIIDIIVVVGSVFIIGIDKAMYTFITVWIGAKAIDFIVDGLDERVAVFIISNHSKEILNKITETMSRGLTILDGKGGYTGIDKEVLYIVINKQELVRLQKIIRENDDNAYVTIHSVHEVMRKGFKAGK